MKLLELRKAVIKRSFWTLAIIVVASIMIYGLASLVQEKSEKKNWLKGDISSLNAKLDGLNQKRLAFSEAVKIWETIPEKNKDLHGLKINQAKTTLEEFEHDFKLSEVSTVFSKPVEIKEGLVTQNVKVISSDVTIQFKALTDEYAYNFLYALEHDFPGYVHLKSFTLDNEAQITKDILQRVSEGSVPPLVRGTVDFVWRELKYTPQVENKDKDNGKREGQKEIQG